MIVTKAKLSMSKEPIETKLLKAIDRILCFGYMGKELKKYAGSWLEVPIDEKDAEDLQEFHDICRKLLKQN